MFVPAELQKYIWMSGFLSYPIWNNMRSEFRDKEYLWIVGVRNISEQGTTVDSQ